MRYPGGKGRCYQHLISLMPPHRTYIETHLGGGAVLRHKRPAETNIGLEKDEAVVERWGVLSTWRRRGKAAAGAAVTPVHISP
jgi:site-specific DNA-adenine methylase